MDRDFSHCFSHSVDFSDFSAPILSPRFTDFRSLCAVSCFYQNGDGNLVPRVFVPLDQRVGLRSAGQRERRIWERDCQNGGSFGSSDQAINFGQEIQNFSDITLKEKQYEVLKLLVVEEKDGLALLPTGYGKSLI